MGEKAQEMVQKNDVSKLPYRAASSFFCALTALSFSSCDSPPIAGPGSAAAGAGLVCVEAPSFLREDCAASGQDEVVAAQARWNK